MLVDKSEDGFLASYHARFGCITCHGGVGGVEQMEAAHEGMVRNRPLEETCQLCHLDISDANPTSLHTNLAGYITVLEERGSPETMPQLMTAYDNHCASCHTTCGQCHVSRPASTGSGLLKGHAFQKTPPMNNTCTGCHGSRVNDEYKGKNTDADGKKIKADVHFNPGMMACQNCHTGDEMHGITGQFNHRYDGPENPSCTQEGCHETVGPGDGIAQHTGYHVNALSCQVCHAVPYKNCYACHVQKSEEGVPYFKIEPSEMMFKIGRNPIQSAERPYQYVPVRHVPIARDSFAYYGENLLPNFDSRPTWTYATPHTIQRITPQNETCNACHGHAELFLTRDDVDPGELEANRSVIVEEIP